jgi:hypothetical protein
MSHEEALHLEETHFEEAQHIAQELFESYRMLRTRLAESNLLEPTVRHVEKHYERELSDSSFLTPQDWEMLAVLWLYDKETFVHSIDTYRIAHQRIHRPLYLPDHSLTINLSKEFSREGVTEEQFLRACLLHDIGKLAMPIEVVTNHTTDTECVRILFAHYDSLASSIRTALENPDGPLPATPEALLTALRTKQKRPQSLVPVRLLFTEKECLSAEEKLSHLGLTLDDSILTIMRVHDTYSQKILTEEGFPIEAELAGAHHRHREQYSPTPHTITIGALQVSIDLSDIIHLADVTEAMRSQRHYKNPESSLVVLATLVAHATYHMVDPFVTYIWVADEFSRISPPTDNLQERSHYATIQKFLLTQSEVYRAQLAHPLAA